MTRPPGPRAARLAGAGARSLAWTAAGGLAALALARVAGSTDSVALVQAQAASGPAWCAAPLVLGVAAWQRDRRLAVVATALCLGAAAWTWGAYGGGADDDLRAVPGDRLRLVTANLWLDNPDVPAAADTIAAQEPDVVVLQEVTPRVLVELERTDLWTALPHHVLDAREGFHGSAVLSARPLTGGLVRLGHTDVLEVRLDLASGPLTVVDVHPAAPVAENGTENWRKGLAEIASSYAGSTRTVVAGDFNATGDHAPYRFVVDAGLREAWTEAGTGFGATWPAGRALPPLLRLDHVLLGRDVAAQDAAVLDVPGSDHRAVRVDLVLPDGR